MCWCDTCVGVIHSEISEHCIERKPGDELSRKWIKSLKYQLELKTQDIEKCNSQFIKIQNENETNIQALHVLEEACDRLKKQIADQEKSIAKVKDNNNEDKNVVEMNVSDLEQYLMDITSIVETSLEKIVGDKLNIITAQLENPMVTQLTDKIKEIDNKLNNTIQQSISYADKVKDMSEATSCQPVQTFQSILQETKNQQLIEDKERQARAANFTIHGLKDEHQSEIDNENKKITDEEFVTSFLRLIEIDQSVEPKNVRRLGQGKTDNNTRSLKVEMHDVANKEMVMRNGWKLKNYDGKFKKLRITEDYAQEEMSLRRSFVEKAKVKSQEESNNQYIWRVRGTPKNGLRLMKFIKVSSREVLVKE